MYVLNILQFHLSVIPQWNCKKEKLLGIPIIITYWMGEWIYNMWFLSDLPRSFDSRYDVLMFTTNQCCMWNSDPEYDVRCIFLGKQFQIW